MNDGSDDDTETVALSFGPAIVYIRRPNGGLAAARNTGLRRATGGYVKFLDADDHLHSEQIARQVRLVDGLDWCVCHSTVRLYRESDPTDYVDHVPAAKALLPDLFKDIDWGGIHGFLFPTDLVRRVGGFDESPRLAEDWELLCRIGLLAPRFVVDLEVGAFYRLRPGSMVTDRRRMAVSVGEILLRLHDQLRYHSRNLEWFGIDLLGAEQRAFRRLTEFGSADEALRKRLFQGIRELQERLGEFGPVAGRFRCLARWFGYDRAEWLRAAYVRLAAHLRGGGLA